MKLAISGLFLLGIIAASCAALLVNALRASSVVSYISRSDPAANGPQQSQNVEVLVAARSLSTMTVVDGSVVAVKNLPRDQAPTGYITSSVDVVGRVLSSPIVEGQAFTSKFFTNDGGAHQLAAVIPPGKRAVAISVSDFGGLEGLLYPGSNVDVLLSLRSDGNNNSSSQPVATTLLQGVQVLAVEHLSVVAPAQTVGEMMEDGSHGGGSRRVTLLVDTKQAMTLQLAMQQGTLSLALRNPLDSAAGDRETVRLSTLLGGLPRSSVDAALADASAVPAWVADLQKRLGKLEDRGIPPTPSVACAIQPAPPHWDVTCVHGKETEVVTFALPTPVTTSMIQTK